MYNALFHRILAWINLVILAVMLIDNFWCPSPTLEKFDHDMVGRGAGSRYGHSLEYYVVGNSGDVVQIPNNTDMALEHGDTFFIRKSGLFHNIISVIYPAPRKQMETYEVGLLRKPFWGIVFILVIAVPSLLNIGKKRFVMVGNVNERILWFAFFAVAFYWIDFFMSNPGSFI